MEKGLKIIVMCSRIGLAILNFTSVGLTAFKLQKMLFIGLYSYGCILELEHLIKT